MKVVFFEENSDTWRLLIFDKQGKLVFDLNLPKEA